MLPEGVTEICLKKKKKASIQMDLNSFNKWCYIILTYSSYICYDTAFYGRIIWKKIMQVILYC